MSFIARTTPFQDQLWNVSLLPAATLPPAGKSSFDPTPRDSALRAAAFLSSCDPLPSTPAARAA